MSWKTIFPKSFSGLESVGMKITSVPEVLSKIDIGMKMGMANLITVLFGLYSVKLVNIPL
jgi:hypothetical protein